MSNTYTQIYIHIVFAVENRTSLIRKNWKEKLHKYITGIIQNNNHKLISINSMPDHLHIFIGMKTKQSLSDLIQEVKNHSSKWINDNKFIPGRFQWQSGFGAFSYSHSQIDNVVKYIKNQEIHHEKKSFRHEYLEFLEKYNISYNNQFIFKEIK
jgi:putative transposase